MEALVSIIVPIYNKEKYLERCLDSIKNQSYKNIEVLLIDDGSTDNSGSVCNQYIEIDMRFRVYHIVNSGVANARNYGLENAKGEYISFVDPDDFVAYNYIEELVNVAISTGTKLVTCHSYIIPDGDRINSYIQTYTKKFNKKIISINEYDYTDTINYAHLSVWGAIYHKDIISDIRFSSKFYVGEDTVFFGEALKKAKLITDIDISLYYYIQYKESLSHGKFDEKRYTEILAWKHMCEIYKDENIVPKSSCIVAMCQRCYKKFLKSAVGEINIDKYYQREMLYYMKQNKKVVMKCKNIKAVHKVSYMFFSYIPKISSLLYCIYKKWSSIARKN